MFTPTVLNEQIGAVLTSTMQNVITGNVSDAVTNGLILFHWLNQTGHKKSLDGGTHISLPVMLALNSTAKSYRGFDIGDLSAQEGITTANYPWRQNRVFISLSGIENFQNGGESRLVNLLSMKIDQAILSLRNELNRQAYLLGTGNDFKDILGLAQVIHIAPASNALGMISTNNTAWQNVSKDDDGFVGGSATTFAEVRQRMRNTWNTASRGRDTPTLLLGRQEVYEYYESSLVVNDRFMGQDVVSGEFEGLMFKGAPFFYDPDMPILSDVYASGATAGEYHVYFLNHKHLWWVTAQGADFVSSPFAKPTGQDAWVSDIKVYGNLGCDLRGSQGVYFDIPTGIVA